VRRDQSKYGEDTEYRKSETEDRLDNCKEGVSALLVRAISNTGQN